MLHPFVQFAFISKPINTTLALTGISFVFVAFLLFLISPKDNIKLNFPYIWLWAFGHMMFHNLSGTARNMDMSVIYIIHISMFFIFYYVSALSKFDWKYVTYPLGYSCILISVFCIFQKLGIRQFTFDFYPRPGTLGNPTNTAMYITAVSPFLLLHKRGWLWFIIPMIAVVVLNSGSAALGIYSIVLTYFILKRFYVRFFMFIFGTISLFILKYQWFIDFFSANKKLHVWGMAIQDWMKNAWIGYGMGHFAGKYTTNNGEISWRFLQNHYLYILYTLGIIGLFLLTLFIIPHLKSYKRIIPYTSMVSVLVMSLCSVPMRIYPCVLLTAFNLGVLMKWPQNTFFEQEQDINISTK